MSTYNVSYIHVNAGTCTYLVTVTPGEVLGADILVGVFGTLLKRGHVVPVLPVLVPQVVGVDATTDEAGNNSTFEICQPNKAMSYDMSIGYIQDGKSQPESCMIISN